METSTIDKLIMDGHGTRLAYHINLTSGISPVLTEVRPELKSFER